MRRLIVLFAILQGALGAFAQEKFDVQGKAGCRGIMPENTIAGMIKALDLGVTTLEMDAVISKDLQVVLSQEPYFNHEISLSPDGKLIAFKDQKKHNIFKMDYVDIQQYDVGSKPHPRFPGQQKYKAYKPLLGEMIDSVESYVKLNRLAKPDYSIETKLIPKGDNEFQPDAATYIELIMATVKKKKIEKRVIIQSFDVRTLQYLHKKYPKIRTALLIDEKEDFEDNIKELGFNPTIYSPYSVLVGKSLVEKCHALGIKIIPWTINSTKDIKYLMNLGVDGIITDYPNLMGQLNN
ncbi:glycerophosphodiester phosphodiesterase family protein [Pedobacter insulae]|uniref:Glycerophosphoryl diester phosphodiesterase n=1 Tax=Pedobacter insulae TaxID=414048 RepID=A0A1I2ZRL6_9SPHI|nr:glycerophosphodiester phosphodiesterase family protein [Pedobacter insulae]SFH40532.1 glycerophosphoryl diester phosphodiesterase [Pedobacter insulae]